MATPRAVRGRRARGMSLVELLMASAVVAILITSLSVFLTQASRSSVKNQVRAQGQDRIRLALVEIERDLNDANEFAYAGATEVRFLMDSHRAPWYDPEDDPDGDGIPNRADADDDGDALEGAAVLTYAGAPPAESWRAGFDLQDDDDNNDGKRDVVCRYLYEEGDRTVIRQFQYDEGVWTDPEPLLADVSGFSLSYYGSLEVLDGVPTGSADTNGDRVLDQDEIRVMDGAAGLAGDPLVNFNERRYITAVRLLIVTDSQKNIVAPARFVTELSPALVMAKRKYP